MQSAEFRVSGVGTLLTGVRLCKSEQGVRHITCLKQGRNKSLLSYYTVYYIHSLFTVDRVGRKRCTRIEPLLRNASVG